MPERDLTKELRRLPAVDSLLRRPRLGGLLQSCPRGVVTESVREVLRDLRQQIGSGSRETTPEPEAIEEMVVSRSNSLMKARLVPVINATGIILHTNLGRAVLSRQAQQAVEAAAGHYLNLEMDLASGERGSRQDHLVGLLTRLTGAETAVVVNNNAAAVLLCLGTLARGKEVIISRGQLVEIGGSFRVAEVMAASGARLKEVGSTNKTHLRDYERAISSETALLLKVHASNFRIVGFTHQVGTEELVALGHSRGIPVMEDLGSGLLLDLGRQDLADEPLAPASVAAGVDVLTFSGDKLLGGPQAGIVVGKEKYLAPLRHNPMIRALRLDKLSLAALEATLRLYLDPATAIKEIPVLHALLLTLEELESRACRLCHLLSGMLEGQARLGIRRGFSQAGGGSLPGVSLPTFMVEVEPLTIKMEELAARLRRGEPPVLVRRLEGKLVLDVRTLLEGEEALLARALVSGMEGV